MLFSYLNRGNTYNFIFTTETNSVTEVRNPYGFFCIRVDFADYGTG